MRKILIIIAILLLITACSAGERRGVAPADGPVPVPTESPPPPAEQDQTPNFQQKYTYEDGVAVEVTKIKTGRVSRLQAEESLDTKIKPGMDYAQFTVRIRNGSKDRLRLGGEGGGLYIVVNYGPDGEQATDLDLGGQYIGGTILPGRAKSGSYACIIPRKYWNDVVMEISIGDLDNELREPVVFAGPIK